MNINDPCINLGSIWYHLKTFQGFLFHNQENGQGRHSDEPDLTQTEFGPWGPNPTQNRVQIGFIWVYQVQYRIEPILRPTRPTLTRFFILRVNPTRLNPNFGSEIGFNSD